MTAPLPQPPPVIHLPFATKWELKDAEYERQLRKLSLKLLGHREQADLEIAEWEMTDPDFPATLALIKSVELEDLGSAHFSGQTPVDCAMYLLPALHYIPAPLLHQVARTASEKELREIALQVLSQLYTAELGTSHWDPNIELTTRIVRRDPDRELRRRALFIEMVGRSSAAGRHIRELLEAETDPAERRQLAILRDVHNKSAGKEQPPAAEEEISEPELRLAFSIYQDAPFDKIVSRFKDFCTIKEDVETDFGGGARLVELQSNDSDARLTLAVPGNSRVGCAYFSGPDAVDMALGFGTAVAYFPQDLAKHLVRHSEFIDYRVDALQALALSASTRILPGKGMDPEIRTLLQDCLDDSDSEVQSAAVNMSVFLRGELSQT
jgi:hypothetical protein